MCASSRCAQSAVLFGPGHHRCGGGPSARTRRRWGGARRARSGRGSGARRVARCRGDFDGLMPPPVPGRRSALHGEVPEQAHGDRHERARGDVLHVHHVVHQMFAERVPHARSRPRRPRSGAPGPRRAPSAAGRSTRAPGRSSRARRRRRRSRSPAPACRPSDLDAEDHHAEVDDRRARRAELVAPEGSPRAVAGVAASRGRRCGRRRETACARRRIAAPRLAARPLSSRRGLADGHARRRGGRADRRRVADDRDEREHRDERRLSSPRSEAASARATAAAIGTSAAPTTRYTARSWRRIAPRGAVDAERLGLRGRVAHHDGAGGRGQREDEQRGASKRSWNATPPKKKSSA